MELRKQIFGGALGTVVGGVLLLPITSWWDKNEAIIPDALLTVAAYMWAPAQIPRIVALVFLAALIPLFVYAFRKGLSLRSGAMSQHPPPTTMRRVRAAVAESVAKAPAVAPVHVAAARPQDIETMPAMNLKGLKLDPDEEKILVALTKMGKFADERKLLNASGLTQFRFDHALGSLRARHFVNVAGSYTNGTTVSFKQDGREFAAQNNLDKR